MSSNQRAGNFYKPDTMSFHKKVKDFPSQNNIVWMPQPGSQEAFLSSSPIFEVLYQGTRGGGKCIADYTKVLTTKGWKKADQITLGDELIAEDGSPTAVLGIFPQPEKVMYRVTFKDGASIVCGHDHLWKCCHKKKQRWKILKTSEMSKDYTIPYMSGHAQVEGWEDNLASLRSMFAENGYVNAKTKSCHLVYHSFRKKEIGKALRLAWSLGGKGSLGVQNTRTDQVCITVSPMNRFNPFPEDTREYELVAQHTYTNRLKRPIASIEEVEPTSSRCFAVSHPSHTFIIEDWVVTHNTGCLLMSFAMQTGKGFGPGWKGVLFRQTYKQLTDVISKSKKWFNQIWPYAKFNNSDNIWTWPTGEQLYFRQFAREDDYWNYHGHEYPWIGWEELCNWATDGGYKRMMSCCRSSTPGMPRMIRSTTNPYGPGHNWVKMRFLPDQMNMKVRRDVVDEEGMKCPPRLSVFSDLRENKIMLKIDPDYVNKIAAAARNKAEKKAWLDGSWDIVSGGMFDDVWDADYNIVQPFDIPENWNIKRSFDWGSSKPFSVGWWAISNGEDVRIADGTYRATIRGDAFRIAEWYGWTGKPNEGLRMLAVDISKGIVEKELAMGFRNQHDPMWCRVKSGVADSQIFSAENGNCIATDMKNRVRLDNGRIYRGVAWAAADKRAGSRITGWDQLRRRMKNAHPSALGPREKPGLFVFNTCENFIRTMPVLPRCKKQPDDVDTDTEDHIADESRYLIRFLDVATSSGTTTGHF